MSKDEKCRNCKYHYIEELSFDYPQSCCSKRNAIIEAWFNCSEFEYSESYINELQQENQQLKENWNKLKEYMINQQEKYFEKYPDNLFMGISVNTILNKMQELEQGSDSSE